MKRTLTRIILIAFAFTLVACQQAAQNPEPLSQPEVVDNSANTMPERVERVEPTNIDPFEGAILSQP